MQEIERVQEMLEDAPDCKWIYQSLIGLSTLYRSQTGKWPQLIIPIGDLVDKLVSLDPLRAGKWGDLKKDLDK